MGTTADLELGDAVAPGPAVSVEITSTPVLSYALAHNRVPVVSRLAITNLSGPVRGATAASSGRLSGRAASSGPVPSAAGPGTTTSSERTDAMFPTVSCLPGRTWGGREAPGRLRRV